MALRDFTCCWCGVIFTFEMEAREDMDLVVTERDVSEGCFPGEPV